MGRRKAEITGLMNERDFRVPLQDGSVHSEHWLCGEHLRGEGACINRKCRTKLVEESGSMRLLDW
jgi:hypothetical protein